MPVTSRYRHSMWVWLALPALLLPCSGGMLAFPFLPDSLLSGYSALQSNAMYRAEHGSSVCSFALPSHPVVGCVVRGDPAPPDESSWLIRLYVPDRSDYRFRWHFRSSLTPCSRDIDETSRGHAWRRVDCCFTGGAPTPRPRVHEGGAAKTRAAPRGGGRAAYV